MKLEKAKITELGTPERSFDVQFNPTSLRLTLDNRITGGATTSNPVRQFVGPSQTTLALDLIFDTADEAEGDSTISAVQAVSVRRKTQELERFLFPKGDREHVPPRIRFSWGDVIVEGVVDSLTVDFDHFASDGKPLRAKVSLSIKGQDATKELKPISPGGRQDSPPPGGSSRTGLGAGSFGFGASLNIGIALGGESAGEFAARVGLDPAAWRGLELGGESSLSLPAGIEVGFDANLSASAGLGVTVGVEAGASASLEASFGLEASAGTNAVGGIGVGADLAAGFALSSAGGVSAAIASVSTAKNQAAEQQARSAFKAPPKSLPAAGSKSNHVGATSTARIASATGAQPKPPEQKHTPLKSSGLPTSSAQQEVPAAPRLPRADPRASSFGFGVPLRSTVGEAADRRAESIRGDVAVKSKIASGDPPSTSDPTTPPWVALPNSDLSRKAADKTQHRFRPARPCGCSSRKH